MLWVGKCGSISWRVFRELRCYRNFGIAIFVWLPSGAHGSANYTECDQVYLNSFPFVHVLVHSFVFNHKKISVCLSNLIYRFVLLNEFYWFSIIVQLNSNNTCKSPFSRVLGIVGALGLMVWVCPEAAHLAFCRKRSVFKTQASMFL